MIEFLQDSIQNHDINRYKIYITTGDIIENDVGIHIINTKLSPAIIQSCRSICSGFSARHYVSNIYCDKNNKLEIINGSKTYKREHMRDYFIDKKKNMIISSLETSNISNINFPSKMQYFEKCEDIEEYTISDTISLRIKNNKEILISVKKDEYIDTTIDSLKSLIESLKCSDDN